MRLMRRVRDGKVAVYDESSIASGRWEEVVERQPDPPKRERAPRKPYGPRPVIARTTDSEVRQLFSPPVDNEAQTA